MAFKESISQMFQLLSPRMQEVLGRRFGLASGKPETLEAIGATYAITRERVRQIEAHALSLLQKPEAQKLLAPFVKKARSYFERSGGLRRRDIALRDLGAGWGQSRLVLSERDSLKGRSEQQRAEFLLEASRAFLYQPETHTLHPFWALDAGTVKRCGDFIKAAVSLLKETHAVIPQAALVDFLAKARRRAFAGQNPAPEALRAYLETSKLIGQNPFGQYGLAEWSEVNPRGVRDYAYLVFAAAKRPLHFRELAREMNTRLKTDHPAHEQTVHNELIKDPRFVLVGRGIYALKEWGYESGTVREVLASILSGNAPLTREEIMEKIKAQRMVKENTIFLNLQNRKYFVRLADGRYTVNGKKGMTTQRA